jgi:hypothetical protein
VARRRTAVVSLCALLVAASLLSWFGTRSERTKRVGAAVQDRTATPRELGPREPSRGVPARRESPPPAAAAAEAREFPPPSEPAPFADGVAGMAPTPAGHALGQYLAAMAGVGSSAEARYQERLRELRRHASEAVRLAHALYESTPKGEYYARQAAVEALGALDSHEAAAALGEIATETIPAGLVDNHGDSRLASEGTIRFSAIRALGELAAAGNDQARSSLRDLADSGHPTVQLYAAQVYVEAHDYSRASRREVAALLPPEDRLLLEAKPVAASDLPALDPDLRKPIDPAKRGAKTPPATPE